MTLSPGTHLAHYEIISLLGEGGMGQVYRARDPKLDRDVAIKVLPEAVAEDQERLARFEREAKSLAALNHPNIATIHGFEQEDHTHFLVMELVEGEDLAERLARGPIPVEEVLPMFLEIVEGLEAAHGAGIVHRDLKPANLKIGDDGRAKILDFGLAKAMAPASESGDKDLSRSPTMTLAATRRGEILGTAAYMAPEQAKGAPVDKRADIWAFGVCLYEALTGRRAFAGDDASEILASVLKDQPSEDALPSDAPVALQRLVRRCLVKQPKGRLQDIGDARLEIEEALAEASSPAPSLPAAALPRARVAAIAFGALLAGVALGGLGVWILSGSGRPERAPGLVTRSSLAWATEPLARRGERERRIAVLSPDGRSIVYRDRDQLWLRRVDGLESTPLAGTEGAWSPFFSPDSESVAFFTEREIKRVSLSGGAPQTVAQVSVGLTGAWGPDDTIVFGIGGPTGLWRVPASGGVPEPWTELGENERDHDWPQVLPDGDHVLFAIAPPSYEFNRAQIAVQSLSTGARKLLVEGGTYPRYSPTGHLLFARSGQLMAVPFDVETLEIEGNPIPVVEDLEQHPFISGVAEYSLSETGHLLYGRGDFRFPRTTPVWVDRQGRETEALALGRYQQPRISPDGSRLAVTLRDEGMGDLYVFDLTTGTQTRLTFEQSGAPNLVWSTDGTTVFFNSEARNRILSRRADGSGPIEEVVAMGFEVTSLSPSGDLLLGVTKNNEETGWDIVVADLGEDSRPRPLIATPAREEFPAFSPDGNWIAYQSDESGETHVYVQPFPDVESGKWQISAESDSGGHPIWHPDGTEIFYRDGTAQMVVRVTSDGPFAVGRPMQLFDGPYERTWWASRTISPDGERLLMLKTHREQSAELILVHNWFEELERLVPVD